MSMDGLAKMDAPATDYYRIIDLAKELDLKGEYAAALLEWRRAVQFDPQDGKARFYLAVALQQQGQLDEAIGQFQKAVEFDPDLFQRVLHVGREVFEPADKVDGDLAVDSPAREVPAREQPARDERESEEHAPRVHADRSDPEQEREHGGSAAVGGGRVEADTIRAALEVMEKGSPVTLPFVLTEEHGFVCGGSITVYLEPHAATRRLVMFGAGHVGREVACLAHRMMMNPENALSGETTRDVIGELLKKVEVPLVSTPDRRPPG